MDYITVQEASVKWNLSERRIQILCKEGRIDGLLRFGRSFMIPKDANKPSDARIKSGKYINFRKRNDSKENDGEVQE